MILVLWTALPAISAADDQPVEVPVFPNFGLATIDGSRQIELHSLHGRPVLLTFWASWCGPCRMELPELEKLAAELADEDFALVTINTDQLPAVGVRFLQRYGIDVPAYRVHPQTLLRLGVESLPTNVLLDREGRPVGIYRGYSPALPDEIRRMVRAMDGGPPEGDSDAP